jgi:uncharacterized membrane protein
MLLPPIPSWDAAHPLVVHFPIALLFAAPLFVVAGLLLRDRGRPYLLSALALLVLGTAGAFVAVSTGEAGEDAAEAVPAASATLERHEELAEQARNAFAALTALYAVVLFGPALFKRTPGRAVTTVALSAFLALDVAALALLANAAHYGGQLVHAQGVRATAAPGGVEAPPAAAAARPRGGDDDDD